MKSLKQVGMLGNKAPDFTLHDDRSKLVSLSDFRGQWVVLYFYPKDMTSGCTLEAQEFRDHEYEFSDLDAVVLGISPDSVESHRDFCDNQGLNFTLLADPTREAIEAYDVWHEKSLYGRKYMGVERTTFLIDPKGAVAKIYDKVKPLGHATAIIEDLRALQEKQKKVKE